MSTPGMRLMENHFRHKAASAKALRQKCDAVLEKQQVANMTGVERLSRRVTGGKIKELKWTDSIEHLGHCTDFDFHSE